jgi:hypothetical protein
MLILTRLMAALSQKKQSGSRCDPRYLIRRLQFDASQQIWVADVAFGSKPEKVALSITILRYPEQPT